MPRLLPIFPLNLVVFPGEKLNLHIFEPRYRELVLDCLTDGITFGIPPFLDGKLQVVGTEMRLLRVERTYPSGESDIRTLGTQLFRVEEIQPQAPGRQYTTAQVEPIEDHSDVDIRLKQRINSLLEPFYTTLGLEKLYAGLAADYRIFDLGHHLGLSTEQEYQLLELRTEPERQQMVLEHLEHTIPMVLEMERLKERVRQNGHFKHLTPPHF